MLRLELLRTMLMARIAAVRDFELCKILLGWERRLKIESRLIDLID